MWVVEPKMSIAAPVRAERPKPEYFGALDGFRGALAILIAIYHTIWLTHFNASALLNNGPVLVDLFFVFSGFLMFGLYRGTLQSAGEAKTFIRKRLARIYPLHFFMLMMFTVYACLRIISHLVGVSVHEDDEILPFMDGAAETVGSFLSNLTLTQSMGLHDSLSYNPPAWTVSVEFWAYFVFLGMMMWAPPKRAWHFGLIAVMVAALYGWLSTQKPDMDFHYDLGFWRCLAGFYTGVLTAWLYTKIKPRLWAMAAGGRDVRSTTLEVFTLIVLYCFVIYCPGKLQFFLAPVAILFVLTFAIGGGYVSKLMTTRPALYIGKISYSIYMVHVLISIFFGVFAERIMPGLAGPDWNATMMGGNLLLIPYLAVVIIVSHFTYHYVERPGQRAIMAWRAPAWLVRLFKRKASPAV